MKEFYFNKFENRTPYSPIEDNKWRTYTFQFLSIITLAIGLAYINWRWRHSINYDSITFALTLVVAETLSFIGTVLIVINYWSNKDPLKQLPVHYLSEIEDLAGRADRPVKIDIFIATYNEDVELVRYTIKDAKKITYPFNDVPINIYVLDDGRRDGRHPNSENMKKIALQEQINYLTRESNLGFKAGNLKNALEHSNGDLFVIFDADTRPFQSFLENTSGYFRNKKLAWVQTPQWFYDYTESKTISQFLRKKLKNNQAWWIKIISKSIGKIKYGEDLFGNDPRLFYDVLLRRRNYYNAAFCCGAGSIHRREALLNSAIKDFGQNVNDKVNNFSKGLKKIIDKNFIRSLLIENSIKNSTKSIIIEKEIIPFKYHASEDIYTSLMLHADKKKWESIQHKEIECKMLSPLDINSWVKQRTRYAAGSLDIAFKDNPLFLKGLTLGQRISYFNTIYSYFAPLWIIVFLLSPIIFFYFQLLPVRAYSFDFFKYFIPFQILNTVIMTLGCWGINTSRGDQYYISCFWLMFLSIISTIRGKKVAFQVTPKNRVFGNYFQHIFPHLTIIILTLFGIIYNLTLVFFDLHPSLSGFISNSFWGLINVYNLSIIVRAALWKPESE